MHKEGLETYNDLIKIFILLLCTSIRQNREIEIIITCTSPYSHNNVHDHTNYNIAKLSALYWLGFTLNLE